MEYMGQFPRERVPVFGSTKRAEFLPVKRDKRVCLNVPIVVNSSQRGQDAFVHVMVAESGLLDCAGFDGLS